MTYILLFAAPPSDRVGMAPIFVSDSGCSEKNTSRPWQEDARMLVIITVMCVMCHSSIDVFGLIILFP